VQTLNKSSRRASWLWRFIATTMTPLDPLPNSYNCCGGSFPLNIGLLFEKEVE
jgi:hypothetical protein